MGLPCQKFKTVGLGAPMRGKQRPHNQNHFLATLRPANARFQSTNAVGLRVLGHNCRTTLADTRAIQHPDKQSQKLRALFWGSEPMKFPGPHQRSPAVVFHQSAWDGSNFSQSVTRLRHGTRVPVAPAATHRTLPQPTQGCPVVSTDHQPACSGQRHASTHEQVRTTIKRQRCRPCSTSPALFHARKKHAANSPPTAKINTPAHCGLRFEVFWGHFLDPKRVLKRTPKRIPKRNPKRAPKSNHEFYGPKRNLVLGTKTEPVPSPTSARNPFRNIHHLLRTLPFSPSSRIDKSP